MIAPDVLRRRRRLRSLLALACAACNHTDLATNAPGHVDVLRPPADLSSRAVERPSDPGEQMLLVGYGGFGGGGFQSAHGHIAGTYAIGPEASVGYGWRRESHREDEPLLGSWILPDHALTMNLGWTTLTGLGKGVGPVYAEVEYSWQGLVGFAGGWTWDPDDRTHGPQATMNVGPLYARFTEELTLGPQVTFGIVLKGEHAFVWSQ